MLIMPYYTVQIESTCLHILMLIVPLTKNRLGFGVRYVLFAIFAFQLVDYTHHYSMWSSQGTLPLFGSSSQVTFVFLHECLGHFCVRVITPTGPIESKKSNNLVLRTLKLASGPNLFK